MAIIRPTTREAYQLFHEGSLALAEAEFNGIRCDRKYCERMIANLERQARSLTQQLGDSELGKVWAKRFGKPNYDSDAQLRAVLFEDLALKPTKFTSGGKHGKGSKSKTPAVDVEVLESFKVPGLDKLVTLRGVGKMSGTYLKNFLLESAPDNYIHPFFHLYEQEWSSSGGARSFRGSSSDPNFQNNPNRHENERKLIRRAFLPRPGHRLVGRDYGAMEFKISACLHHDPNMIRYIEQGDDPHRDVAAMAFMLDPQLCTKKYGEHGKNVRFVGKNSGTFAQMYFQEPKNTAAGLWKGIKDLDLRVPNDPDKSLFEHFKDKKIRNFDAYDKYITDKMIPWFWQEMFPHYGKWREKWISDYNKNGYFDMLTGFRVEGVMTKYQLGNYPIQGPAFHCLLWTLIQVHRLWDKRREDGWKSLIVGQIHDELTTDEHEDEFWKNQEEIPKIMAEDIRKEWPWIIVPLEVESDATPVDVSWYEKREVK